MRVIEEKHNNRLKEYLLVCCNCGSKLGVTVKDTKAGQYNEQIVECPICGTYNNYDEKNMIFIKYINYGEK